MVIFHHFMEFCEILKAFFTILVTMAATHFFAFFLLSIQYLNLTIRCVSLEQLLSVIKHFAMSELYVCICLKLSFNYSQTVGVFVFFYKIEWVNMVLSILNLEGQKKKHDWFQRYKVFITVFIFYFLYFIFLFMNFKRRHVGCLSRGK